MSRVHRSVAMTKVLLPQVSSILLLILLHDALLVFGGFSLANNFFTLDLEGGLIVKKKSLQLVPSGGTATVGSGKLNQNKTENKICRTESCACLMLIVADIHCSIRQAEGFIGCQHLLRCF